MFNIMSIFFSSFFLCCIFVDINSQQTTVIYILAKHWRWLSWWNVWLFNWLIYQGDWAAFFVMFCCGPWLFREILRDFSLIYYVQPYRLLCLVYYFGSNSVFAHCSPVFFFIIYNILNFVNILKFLYFVQIYWCTDIVYTNILIHQNIFVLRIPSHL